MNIKEWIKIKKNFKKIIIWQMAIIAKGHNI